LIGNLLADQTPFGIETGCEFVRIPGGRKAAFRVIDCCPQNPVRFLGELLDLAVPADNERKRRRLHPSGGEYGVGLAGSKG